VKIGYLGKQDSFAVALLKKLKQARGTDEWLTWLPGEQAPATDLDVLIGVGKIGEKEFAGQTKLGLVQTASAGYEGVDVGAASAQGIWVASAPTTRTGNGESVAEFAVLLMLAASRRLQAELAWVADRTRERPKPEENKALFGKTACLVGLGGIGDLLAERLQGFGMVLTGVDKHPEHAPAGVKAYGIDQLKEALHEADYILLEIPGTMDNEDLVNGDALQSMKEGAILVNVGRGSLVDEGALLAAVRSGHLFGAGLDVVKREPLEAGNPLRGESSILVTPHIAGPTDLTLKGTARYLVEVLEGFEKGSKPAGVVNEPDSPRVSLQ
jgi:phosphoglycerate dehydrogenase-like enzyme